MNKKYIYIFREKGCEAGSQVRKRNFYDQKD